MCRITGRCVPRPVSALERIGYDDEVLNVMHAMTNSDMNRLEGAPSGKRSHMGWGRYEQDREA